VGSRAAGAYTTPANVANTVTGNNSNNGVVYPAPTITVTSYRTVLDYQATLTYPSTSTVYPSGRLVNPLLKSALTKIDASTNLDLSEQSAVDSALCALQIIGDTSFTPSDTVIPHGAILETTFLDARQVKAVDKPYTTSATTYDLDVELRQPLEIHATALDLDLLRRTTHSTGEFLFPNSGVIYATRDDALPDASSETDATANNNASDLNGTDFKLDPTRRPNAIMLFNGSDISRNSTYVAAEKGLILASNLPVYIKGNLNTHAQEEFTTALDTAPGTLWSNFYTRSALNPQFACRNGQFTTCTTGETWRPATILADAITVLSNTFKLGYRSDGDYNLRDNYGNYTLGYDYNGDGSPTNASVTLDETALQFDINANGNMTDTAVVVAENAITGTVAARLNGFWDNNFVTSRSFTDANYSTGTPTSSPTGGSSSYFNNFVTPVQRRVTFSEYVMEICLKNVVTACQPDDWYVGYDLDGLNGFSQSEIKIKANELDYVLLSNSKTFDKTKLLAGTTAQAAATGYQVYPRRVAFLRWSDSSLYNSSTGPNYNKSFVMSAITTGSNAGNKYVNNGASYFYTAPTTNPNNKLLFPKNNSGKAIGSAVALGISSSGALTYINQYNIVICNLSTAAWTTGCLVFDNTTSSTYTLGSPSTAANALWFKTNNSGVANYSSSYPLWIQNTSGLDDRSAALQPLLVPVLQIQYPTITSGTTDPMTDSKDAKSQGNWFQVATATTSNVVYAQGDTPGRPATTGNTGETGGGLENAVHLLENWQGVNFTATGAFIQFKRSSYATAPWQSLITTFNTAALGYSTTGTIFGYPQGYHVTSTNVSGQILGRSPFYVTPNRLWGYDVALLTQLPDLFSQRFTSLPTNAPNEFFREVGKDDSWVQTLLCGAQSGDSGGYGSATAANYGSSYQYAVSQDQRGTCN
jgi:hypothetical protein